MLTIKEEKELFFPNHTWSDFQRKYVNKLKLVTDAWDTFMMSEISSPELLSNLMNAIIDTTKRLYEIDNHIAKSIEVQDYIVVNPDELF